MKLIINGITAFLLCLSMVSCQEKKTENLSNSGTLRILATDAPFDFDLVSSAKISVTSVTVRSDAGEKTQVMDHMIILDLMQLRNGITETLSEVSLPAGNYNEIILKVSSASIDLKDGRNMNLAVPSGASSGLKIFVKPSFTVHSNAVTDVLLDFDLSRSFVPLGTAQNITGFNFKPVIRASVLALSGTISGQVLNQIDDAAVAGAIISVKSGENIIATAVTDDEGMFKILGLSPASYKVTAEASAFGSLTIDAVPVTQGQEVTTHFILTPVTVTQ